MTLARSYNEVPACKGYHFIDVGPIDLGGYLFFHNRRRGQPSTKCFCFLFQLDELK